MVASDTYSIGLLEGASAPEPANAVPVRWRWRALTVALILAYIAGWGFSASFPINTTDLDAFFLPSARFILSGHALHAYAVRYAGPYPNANGPLSLFPLAGAAWVARRLGWLNDPTARRVVIMAIFAIFPLLVSYEAVRAMDRLRGVALRGFGRLLAYAVFALTPQLWHSMLFYGHIEQPIELWLALLGIRLLVERRAGWAGVCMGGMLLTRSSSLVVLLPLVVVLLCRGRWRPAALMTAVAGAVTALGVLPFWLGDRADTLYSLVTFRTELVVGGGSIWGLAIGTPWQAFAQAHDSLVVIGAATIIALIVALARRSLDVDSREIYVLLAITSLCFPLFIKTSWPYYFIEPYVFIGLWWLAGLPRVSWRARLLWLTGLLLLAAILGMAQLGEMGVGAYYPSDYIRRWSLEMSLAMSGMILVLAGAGLLRIRPRAGLLSARAAPTQPEYNA